MDACGVSIRSPKTGLRRACPGELKANGDCSFGKFHLTSARSGWCITGHHEGKKAEVNGVAQSCCRLWQSCPCDCHDTMSKILAPRRQQREPVSNGWKWKTPHIADWLRKYEAKQSLLNNPEIRIKHICEVWASGDKSTPCTAEYIVSQTLEEKPLNPDLIARVLAKWHENGLAFASPDPVRFFKFL